MFPINRMEVEKPFRAHSGLWLLLLLLFLIGLAWILIVGWHHTPFHPAAPAQVILPVPIAVPMPPTPVPPAPIDIAIAPGSHSPFNETVSTAEMPTLTVTNKAGGDDRLTLTNEAYNYTLILPNGQTRSVTLQPGTYRACLSSTRLRTWEGRTLFRRYRNYSTNYVAHNTGIPLTFGE